MKNSFKVKYVSVKYDRLIGQWVWTKPDGLTISFGYATNADECPIGQIMRDIISWSKLQRFATEGFDFLRE